MLTAMILVSACLAGTRCTYARRHHCARAIKGLVESGRAVAVCPEVLGGLGTPREMSEIRGGAGADVLDGRARVLTRSGKDVTRFFVAGARAALRRARQHSARTAVLKSGSPSCGCGSVSDGTFSGKRRAGYGVAAELLRRHGITVMSERQFLARRRRRQPGSSARGDAARRRAGKRNA